MYEAFFHLSKRPFSATPDATCCVLSESNARTLQELTRCVRTGQGIGILTAPAGMGKTLLCRKLINDLGPNFTTVYLGTGAFSTRRALLQSLLYELGQPYSGMGEQELRLELFSAIKTLTKTSDGLCFVFDEAHLLGDRSLEEIRILTDLARDGKALANVILSGHLELEERLTTSAHEALNQRVAVTGSLHPLSHQEAIDYISFRLHWAGGNLGETFDEDALDLIVRACDGLPRCINQLCDHTLLLSYVSDLRPAPANIVRDALSDLKQLPLHWNPAVLSESEAAPAVSAPESRNEDWSEIGEDSADWDEPLSLESAASIEIGAGVDSEITVEAPVAPVAAAPEPVVPAAEPTRQPTPELPAELADLDVSEEFVFDRYALLDAGKLLSAYARHMNVQVKAGGTSAIESELPPVDLELPVPRTKMQLPEGDPAGLIDLVSPLVAQAQETTWPSTDVAKSKPGLDEFIVEPPIELFDSNLAFEAIVQADEAEEQIGSTVLDVCFDAQQAITDRLDEIEEERPILRHRMDGVARITRFDVVQPEPDAGAVPEPEGRRRPSGAVPPPNYKNLFSMLRRRQKNRS
ncbi:MAG TPA: AAA family ATPase [Planctomycetaceae bacterium]|nr:AAA family ATPase [Planctomycetaceae bacterium]